MTTYKVIEYRLPVNAIRKSPGFGLDIGMSIAKIAYRPKEHYSNGEPNVKEDDDMGRIHLVNIPYRDIDDVIKIIKEKCDYDRSGSLEVKVAGWGPGGNKEMMEKELNVRMTLYSEFVCMFDTVSTLLKCKPAQDLFEELSSEAKEKGEHTAHMRMSVFKQLGDALCGEGTQTWSTQSSSNLTFPLLFTLCGSGFLFFKMYEDGKFELLEIAGLGGRAYLGLAGTLAETQDFEDIRRYVHDNDGRSTDVCGRDYTSPSEETDEVKDTLPPDEVILPFGKGWIAPRESLTPGDKAYSITRITSLTLAQQAFMTAKAYTLKDILFCGNFITIDKVQDWVTTELCMKNELLKIQGFGEGVNFQFVKNGGSFGALGCFMHTSH